MKAEFEGGMGREGGNRHGTRLYKGITYSNVAAAVRLVATYGRCLVVNARQGETG